MMPGMANTKRTMHWHRVFAALLLAGLLGLQSCLYADFKTTLDTDLNQTQLGDKVGESSTQSVMWLVAWGDGGTQSAAENGGIKTINHADTKVFSFLWGLYTRVTTVVYGE